MIALDLGGTKLASAVFADDGQIVRKQVSQLDARHGGRVGELISAQVESHLLEAQSRQIPIEAVGVSVPGIYHQHSRTVWAPNISGWDDYPLYSQLEAVAPSQLVKIDSDRACYILGEVWQGGAQGCADAIFLAVGTGIGAGILVDGRVLRGHHDIAGAIGWLALDKPYLPEYDPCGCFEYHASGAGIAKVARDYLAKDETYEGVLRQSRPNGLTAHDVFAAYDVGDSLAKKVVDNCISFWGMAVANLVSLFNPEKIIFGGGVFGPASQLIGLIQNEASKWAQPISMQQVSLEASRLSGDAGLVGAGYLARTALHECD